MWRGKLSLFNCYNCFIENKNLSKFSIFKLRLGASIGRLVRRSVSRSVCLYVEIFSKANISASYVQILPKLFTLA